MDWFTTDPHDVHDRIIDFCNHPSMILNRTFQIFISAMRRGLARVTNPSAAIGLYLRGITFRDRKNTGAVLQNPRSC